MKIVLSELIVSRFNGQSFREYMFTGRHCGYGKRTIFEADGPLTQF
jgi:hypothetical protein